MEKEYRELFDGIRASGRLREDVMDLKNQERREPRPAGRGLRPVLAAVLAVLLLGACAAAPGAARSLVEYFAGLWSERNDTPLSQEQSDFIGTITQTVGVSDTVDGVTVTLEAVTAGESSLWMLLSVDGLDVPAEELVEAQMRFASGGMYLDPEDEMLWNREVTVDGPWDLRASGDGQFIMLLRAFCENASPGVTFLTKHQVMISLQDICTYTFSDTGKKSSWQRKSLLAEGIWRLKFDLEPPAQEPEAIVLHDVTFPAMRINLDRLVWEPYAPLAKELRLTSTEMHIYWNEDGTAFPTGEISLLLDDGTEVGSPGGGGARVDTSYGLKVTADGGVCNHFIVPWDLPVELSRAAALRVGEETIPLK